MFQPPGARAAGYDKLVFYDDFDSYSTIDMTNSQSGNFNWYLAEWFSHGGIALSPSDFSISGSVLTLSEQNLTTAFDTNPQIPDNFHGTVFGGGAYIEARFKFDRSLGIGPVFFAMAMEHIADGNVTNDAVGLSHWRGQADHFTHFIEVDIFEVLSTDQSYQAHVHDWYGIWTGSRYPHVISNILNYEIIADLSDPTQFHNYGVLWVPQTAFHLGRVHFYFDDVLKSTNYYSGPPDAPPLPGAVNGNTIFTENWTASTPEDASTTYSVIDSQRLALAIGGRPGDPINVDWVKVWQRDDRGI